MTSTSRGEAFGVGHTQLENDMKRAKSVTLTTEEDIEKACEWMDRRDHDALQELRDTIAECDDDERALVLQARAGLVDDGW